MSIFFLFLGSYNNWITIPQSEKKRKRKINKKQEKVCVEGARTTHNN